MKTIIARKLTLQFDLQPGKYAVPAAKQTEALLAKLNLYLRYLRTQGELGHAQIMPDPDEAEYGIIDIDDNDDGRKVPPEYLDIIDAELAAGQITPEEWQEKADKAARCPECERSHGRHYTGGPCEH